MTNLFVLKWCLGHFITVVSFLLKIKLCVNNPDVFNKMPIIDKFEFIMALPIKKEDQVPKIFLLR